MRRYLLAVFLLIQALLPNQAFADDTEPPVITPLSSASGTTQWWGYVGASFKVTDDAGCCTSAVMELVSQTGEVKKSLAISQQSPQYPLSTTFSNRINLTGDLLGTFSLRATVTDFSGKSTTGSLGSIEIYQPDWGPPTITAGSYAASVYPGESFSGNFWANDDKDCCASASIAVFDSQGTQVVTGTTSFASRFSALVINYFGTIQLPSDIAPGTYAVKAMAVDNLNKASDWAVVGSVTVNDPNLNSSPAPTSSETPAPTVSESPSPSSSPAPTSTIPVLPTSTPTVSSTPTPRVSATPSPSVSQSPSALTTPAVSVTSKPSITPKPIKSPTANSTKAPTQKVIAINCYKGKMLKKVTALKPVCPKGYKKK